MTTRQPTFFISHGGGPWPWMQEQTGDMYAPLSEFLQGLPQQLPEPPKAILVVTAHWETDTLRVSSAARPGMLYDYHGFPPHTYHIQYPAPGSPALAEQVKGLLNEAGIVAELDPDREYDHGTFVPMAVAFPEANVPVVMVSIYKHRDPGAHLAMGRALAPLRDEGVLIVGSGLSFHNLRVMGRPEAAVPSKQFDDWLQQTLTQATPEERTQHLLHWDDAP
ncbi:MAG: class III extradiol ring-cleavage dioxygenase, partial [Natronospirillum sp.]